MKKLDLKGKQFGELQVIDEDTSINKKGSYWICKCSCGKISTIRGTSLTCGNTSSCGCLKSKGEMLIAKILQELHLEYKQQYSFIDLVNNKNNKLYFDFAIIKNEKIICLIEFQGIQHYQPQSFFGGEERFIQQQENDKIKENYCILHSISLIKFSYKELKNIDADYLKVKLISKGVWL